MFEHRRPRLEVFLPVLGLFLLVVRGPELLLRPQFVYEEAGAFWAWSFEGDPIGQILRPWSGFLQVAPRIAFLAGHAVPPTAAPAITTLILFALIAAVAAFLVSDRLSEAIPSRMARLLLASLLFLLPGVGAAFQSVLNAQWFLSVYLLGLLLATDPSRRWAAIDLVGGLIAGLTGPFAIVLAPLFVATRSSPHRSRLAFVMSACAVVQVAVFLMSSRRPVGLADPGSAVAVVIEHFAALVVGRSFAEFTFAAMRPALIVIGLLAAVVTWRSLVSLPRRTVLAALYLSVATAALGLASTGTTYLALPDQGARYFLAAAVVVAMAVAAATTSRRPVGLVLAGLYVFGIVGDLRLAPSPDSRWAEQASCIGGLAPCTVLVEPPAWSVVWPGLHRGYLPPSGFRPDGVPIP